MCRMISAAELVLNQVGHPAAGPDITTKAKGFGTFEQQGDKLSELLGVKQRARARPWLVVPGGYAGPRRPLEPRADRTLRRKCQN